MQITLSQSQYDALVNKIYDALEGHKKFFNNTEAQQEKAEWLVAEWAHENQIVLPQPK